MTRYTTTSGKPLVDFEAYMADMRESYKPLEDMGYQPQMNPGEIKSFFAEQRTIFADRTPEQEKASFDKFFAFKDLARQKNTREHFDVLKAKPEFANRSDKDLEKIASMRSALKEGFESKGVNPEVQKAMFEKFDRVYAKPDAIDRAEAILEVGYGNNLRDKHSSRDEGLSH